MKKTHQQSLLDAVIAVVFLFVAGLAFLIIELTNYGITYMGIPVGIIALIAIIFVVALADYIRRRSDISAMIVTFILLITAAYIVVYKIGQTFLYGLFILLTTPWFW